MNINNSYFSMLFVRTYSIVWPKSVQISFFLWIIIIEIVKYLILKK